jgi:hypothetical protein
MAVKRVRIPCPNCSHRLHIRIEDLARKGECKYCGHRFRPRPKELPDRSANQAESSHPGSQNEHPAPDRWETMLEQELEKCWGRMTAQQSRLVEQLLTTLGSHGLFPSEPIRPRGTARDESLEAELLDHDRIDLRFEDAQGAGESTSLAPRDAPPATGDERPRLGEARTDAFPLPAAVSVTARQIAMPPDEIAAVLDHLAGERDDALGQCDRLRQKAEQLRRDLAGRVEEIARLRILAKQLRVVRSERDRLNAERTVLTQDAAQLQTRLVEAQFSLVEVEAELDDLRERARLERLEWQQERAELLAEIDRLRAALTTALEGSEFDQPASTYSAG